MLTVGEVKAAPSEVKSLLEIGFTPNYRTGQFSEVNLYWFSLPKVESSEVILTDPNGVVVFTSDKTGENSEVFIPDVIGTYTATITITSTPGGAAKTKEESLLVREADVPSISMHSEVDGTQEEKFIFKQDTGLDLDTKFYWDLLSESGPMSFLIEISDPDGDIVHTVSGRNVIEEVGGHIHTTGIVGEYTVTATATNMVGTATHTETILCKNWPSLQDEANVKPFIDGWAWYPQPDPDKIIDSRRASKWGWWFELYDCYNPLLSNGAPKPDPYEVIFKYNTGTATEAKLEFIDPDGLVDKVKDNLPLTMHFTYDREVNFKWGYFPTKRGTYTARLILKNAGLVDPFIFDHYIPCYDNLEDKEYSPEIWFNPRSARSAEEHDTFTLEWNAKGGTGVAVEWIDPEGNVGTSSNGTGSVEFYGVLGEYTASITAKTGGRIRNEHTSIDVTEYQEPIPSISFSTSNPMVDNIFYIHWDSKSTLEGRTALVEWKDPDGIVLGTYTDLVGSSEKVLVNKIGTYSATITVTTPEGLVVNNSTSVLSVSYSYAPPTLTLR
jgi:hypothetical protein